MFSQIILQLFNVAGTFRYVNGNRKSKSMADRVKKESGGVAKAAVTPLTLEQFSSRNEEMQKCLELARAASQTTASVLILGERGTGKGQLAETIHNSSNRASRPCVTVNCLAVPENVLESELFGHEPGGTERLRRGKFEFADGGTLILDEIAEMSLPVQAQMLRAVEHGEFERVAGEKVQRADVRLIATSHQGLAALVGEGRFRQDLFYRLNEVSIHVPPLRHRREDLRELADGMIRECNAKFGKSVSGISQIAFDYLLRHDFPGNLREMKALLKRAVTVAKSDLLWLEDLGVRVQVPDESESAGSPEEAMSLAVMEKRHIQQVLDYTHGNKKRASQLLQISRPTLDRKIKVYGLRVP